MEILFVFGLLVLSGLISWWNCKSAGSVWIESKKVGGFMRVLVWCAVIQSVVGFSQILIVVLGLGAYAAGYLDQRHFAAAMSLWYLLIIVPALGSGLIITIHSWVQAWRERNIANMGVAAWNTFAQGLNMYNAVKDIPNAWEAVSDVFGGSSSDSKESKGAVLVLLIVVLAIAGGVMITFGLVRHYAQQNLPQPVAA